MIALGLFTTTACDWRTTCTSLEDCKRSEVCGPDGYCEEVRSQPSGAFPNSGDGGTSPEDGCLSHSGPLCLERFEFSGDSNRDGVLSPGERAFVDSLGFRNGGASDILGLTGIISTDSPHVSFDDDADLSFVPYFGGHCPSNDTCSVSNDFNFSISPDAPLNTAITFNLDLADQYDNAYHMEFTTRVVDDDVQLSLERFEISGDSNRDGVLSPGERAFVDSLGFRNGGASDILGLTGIISPDSPHVRFDDDADLSFVPYFGGHCPSNDTCSVSNDFNFSISPDAPLNTAITFVLDLTDQFLNTYRLTHDVQIQ